MMGLFHGKADRLDGSGTRIHSTFFTPDWGSSVGNSVGNKKVKFRPFSLTY
jgi:hypothetical protein